MSKGTVFRALIAGVLLMLVVSGCGKSVNVSKEAYDKIEDDMTLAQVQDILGKGELQTGASRGIGDIAGSARIYEWVDGDKKITVTFVDDKVAGKARAGL